MITTTENLSAFIRFLRWIDEEHPQQQEQDSYDRLMAAIEAQDGVNNDEADLHDLDDRF